MQCQYSILGQPITKCEDYGRERYSKYEKIVRHIRRTCGEQILPVRETTKEVSGISIKKVGNKNPSGKGQSGLVYSDDGIAPSVCAGGKNPNINRDIGYNRGLVFTQERKEEIIYEEQREGIRKYEGYSPVLRANMGTGGNNVPMVIRRCGDKGNQKTYLSNECGALCSNPSSDMIPMVLQHSRKGKVTDYNYSNIVGTLHQPSGNTTNFIIQVVSNQDKEIHAVNYDRISGVGNNIDIAHTLSSSDWCGLNRNQLQTAIVVPVLTPNRINKRQNGRRFKEPGEPSFTLTGQDIQGVMYDKKIRILTPVECERLQSFSDEFTKCGINEKGEKVEISDTQRYKMMGNAVTVNVVYEIAKRLGD